MEKRVIKLHFQNGLDLSTFKKEVFDINGVSAEVDFEESTSPDFIIFGPYGNDIPPRGDYVRIGYYCENIKPDMSVCDWAFGIPMEAEISHPKYKRIQWHGTDLESLIKPDDYNAERALESKKYFCNFLYSHKVPYREEFFKQLSKYKKVDAPGKSMNNTDSIDKKYTGDTWQRKRQFLSDYKFTIAFENDIYPGYQTEKLYDAMQANSLPIYCGDPFIGDVFNTKSFVNVPDYLLSTNQWLVNNLRRFGQMDFEDIRPAHLTGLQYSIKRKIKSATRNLNKRLLFKNMDFSPVIDRIIQLDTEPELYLQYLKEPWLKSNQVDPATLSKGRWLEIFNSR